MSAEQYANAFGTTLSAPMLIDATTASVAAAAPVALRGGQFRIAIGAELLLVTAGAATTTWTVTREIEGTSAAEHAGGSSVTHVLTAASLRAVAKPDAVFDANAYPYLCAPGDNAYDNAAGIAAAIADAVAYAAANNGIGVIEFDEGEYWINGALQTSVGNAYAQIPIPSVANTAAKVLLVLRPKIGIYSTFMTAQPVPQPGLVVFHSSLTGQVWSATYGLPSILGGPQWKRTSTFSNVQLHLQGITFRTGANPSLCGVDAGKLQQAIFEDCRWDTTETVVGGYTQPTHPTGLATIVPHNSNNGMADYRGTNSCEGWYAGPAVGEHTQAEKLLVYQCYVGTNVVGDYYHAAQIDHLSTEWCPYGIGFVDPEPGGLVDPPGPGYATLNVNLWDIEDAPSGWGVPIKHVNDPGNDLHGRIRYLRVLGGSGTVSGALTLEGATNLGFDDLTVAP